MQPKIQKLETKEDLELLVSGDVVLITGNRGIRSGLAVYFTGATEGGKVTLLTRGEGHAIENITAKKNDLSVSAGFLRFKNPTKQYVQYVIWPQDIEEYAILNKILTEAGL